MATTTFFVYLNEPYSGGSVINGRSPESVASELGIPIYWATMGDYNYQDRSGEYIDITFPNDMFPAFGEARGTYNICDSSPNGSGSYNADGRLAAMGHCVTLDWSWQGVVRVKPHPISPSVPPVPPPGPNPPSTPPPRPVPPLSPPPVPPADPPPPPVPPPPATKVRRWIEGFELAELGESATAYNNAWISKDASRVTGGWGFAMRQPGSATYVSHNVTTLGAATTRRSWERFYLKIRKLPAADTPVWRCHGSTSAASGMEIYLSPTGTLKIYNVTAVGTADTLHFTSDALYSEGEARWYRIDILLAFGAVAPDPAFALSINGTMVYKSSIINSDGIGFLQNHTSSTLGTERGASVCEIDFDDWINADYPVYFGFDGTDWVSGSHIVLAKATGWGGNHSSTWVGSFRTGIANPVKHAATQDTIYIESSTSGDVLEAVMEAYKMGGRPVASVLVAAYVLTGGGAGTATIGYNINGGGNQTAAVTMNSDSWIRKLYTTTAEPPLPISSLTLVHAKDTAAGSRRISGLHATVELIGAFGREDELESGGDIFPKVSVHNSPYPEIAEGIPEKLTPSTGTTADGPLVFVALESGTYIGNGQGQDIELHFPSHWVWIRPLSGDTGGSRWFSSMLAAHKQFMRGTSAVQMVQGKFLAVNSSLLRIAGTDTQANASGVTYQWVSVSDVGMRYLMNLGLRAKDSVASYVYPLSDSGFTPDAAFAIPELGNRDSTSSLHFKGSAHAANAASLLSTGNTAAESDALTFSAGSITTRTDVNPSQHLQTAVSLWTETDRASTGDVLFDVTSYVGDGTASRDIALALADNWPLLVLVVPHAAVVSYMRDPSHTASSSSQVGGTSSTTAIIGGGVNKITVGTAINTNGTTYSVFALRGHPDGWYNGGPIILIPGTVGTSLPIDEELPTSEYFSDALGARTDVCRRTLHRLGDSSEAIWTKEEVRTYLLMAVTEMADRTRAIWDQIYLDDLIELTGQRTTTPPAVINLHRMAIEVERVSHSNRGSLTAVTPGNLASTDSRYEITTGEVFGYTWKKDGIRGLRLVRAPSEYPLNLRVDYWRHFDVSCSMSELQPRYFMYLADYMQWKCLLRHGPGQDFKLAQLYKDRWERGLARMLWRVNRRLKAETFRMGGTGPSRPPGPPRPRLPWNFGSRTRGGG